MYPSFQPPVGPQGSDANRGTGHASASQYPTSIHYPSNSHQAYAPPMVYRPSGDAAVAAPLSSHYPRPSPPTPSAAEPNGPSAARPPPGAPPPRPSSLGRCRVALRDEFRIARGVSPVVLESVNTTPLEFDCAVEAGIISSSSDTDANDDPIARFGRAQPAQTSPRTADQGKHAKLEVRDAWEEREERFEQMGYDRAVVRLLLCKYHDTAALDADSKVVDLYQPLHHLLEMFEGNAKPKRLLAAALWSTPPPHDPAEALRSLHF